MRNGFGLRRNNVKWDVDFQQKKKWIYYVCKRYPPGRLVDLQWPAPI